MEKRVESPDGTQLRVIVDDDAVADLAHPRPAIESDPDELDEGATEALVLVDPKPSTMTVEGAIAAVGVTARYLYGHSGSPQPQGSWWHDWGKYVVGLLLMLIVVSGFRFL